MIGMIRPLVKGSTRLTVEAIIAFGLGALASSFAMALVWLALSLIIRPILPQASTQYIAAGLAVALALADLGVGRLRTPTLRYQTRSLWWQTLGHPGAWLAWGAHLGLGVFTIRATSLYWFTVILALLVASPAAVPLVTLYAIGLMTGLAGMAVAIPVLNLPDGGARMLLRSRTPIRLASGALLLGIGAAMLVLG